MCLEGGSTSDFVTKMPMVGKAATETGPGDLGRDHKSVTGLYPSRRIGGEGGRERGRKEH